MAMVWHMNFKFLCWISFRGHPVLTLRVKIQCAVHRRLVEDVELRRQIVGQMVVVEHLAGVLLVHLTRGKRKHPQAVKARKT